MTEALNRISDGLARLREGWLGSTELRGVSVEEIRDVLGEEVFALAPPSYVKFLQEAGLEAGGFLAGSDFLFPQLPLLQEYGEEVRREEPDAFVDVTEPILVIVSHQGYQFLFLQSASEESPVMRYLDSEGVTQLDVTFSQFFVMQIEADIRSTRSAT